VPVGVVEQVRHRPLQPRLVPAHGRDVIGIGVQQVRRAAAVGEDFADQRTERHWCTGVGRGGAVDLGQLQQVVEHAPETGQLRLDQLECLPAPVGQLSAACPEDLDAGDQAGQRAAQLVADVADEPCAPRDPAGESIDHAVEGGDDGDQVRVLGRWRQSSWRATARSASSRRARSVTGPRWRAWPGPPPGRADHAVRRLHEDGAMGHSTRRRGGALSTVLAATRGALWPIPGLGVVLAIGLGVLLPAVDGVLESGDDPLTFVFGGGPAVARDLLAAIAGLLVSVTGLTFSLTVIALQLSSSQYSPRLLQTFVTDRVVQLTLAQLVLTFVYALTVLRTVRTGGATEDDDPFVPRLSITVAYLLTLGSVLALVFFLGHLARGPAGGDHAPRRPPRGHPDHRHRSRRRRGAGVRPTAGRRARPHRAGGPAGRAVQRLPGRGGRGGGRGCRARCRGGHPADRADR
jgi:hypothetical protein